MLLQMSTPFWASGCRRPGDSIAIPVLPAMPVLCNIASHCIYNVQVLPQEALAWNKLTGREELDTLHVRPGDSSTRSKLTIAHASDQTS